MAFGASSAGSHQQPHQQGGVYIQTYSTRRPHGSSRCIVAASNKAIYWKGTQNAFPIWWNPGHSAQDHTNKGRLSPLAMKIVWTYWTMLIWQDYSNPCKYISIQQSGPPNKGGGRPLTVTGLPHPWFVEVSIGSSFNCYFAIVRVLALVDILWAITVEVLSLLCGTCLRRYNVAPVCGCGSVP